MQLQPGSHVTLDLPDSPLMLVVSVAPEGSKAHQDGLGNLVSGGSCVCCWFDKDLRLQRQPFLISMLLPVHGKEVAR